MSELLGMIQLIVWVATVIGFYYKLKNDLSLTMQKAKTDNEATLLQIKLANERIDKIEKEGTAKWENYDDRQCMQDEKLSKIAIGIGTISTDMSWVKKKLK